MNDELDEQTADRLLTGELAPEEVAAGYRQVASLLAATRAEPSAAELSRRADTVRAMAAARRGSGEGVDPSAPSWAGRLARRRSMRLGVVAAATTLSLTTGLAAAGLLPDPLQSIASGVLPYLGDSSPASEDQGPAGPPAETPPLQPGQATEPDSAAGGEALPGSRSGAPEGKEAGSQQAPTASPGQGKQAAKAILWADATRSGAHLVVSFWETGVRADAVTVSARADATARYGCVNRSGRNEKPRKEARVAGVSEAGRQFAAVNGETRGALTLTPPAPTGVSCSAGEAPQLLGVLYSRVVMLDATTGATTTINRTFPATP